MRWQVAQSEQAHASERKIAQVLNVLFKNLKCCTGSRAPLIVSYRMWLQWQWRGAESCQLCLLRMSFPIIHCYNWMHEMQFICMNHWWDPSEKSLLQIMQEDLVLMNPGLEFHKFLGWSHGSLFLLSLHQGSRLEDKSRGCWP